MFNRCFYIDDGGTDLLPTGFKEHRCIEQNHVDRTVVTGCRDLVLQVPPDDRMDNLFQVVPGLLVFFVLTEDSVGQAVPADFVCCIENLTAEPASNEFLDVRTPQGLMTCHVTINNHGVQMLRDPAGECALPGTDTADQRNDRNGTGLV